VKRCARAPSPARASDLRIVVLISAKGLAKPIPSQTQLSKHPLASFGGEWYKDSTSRA